MTFKPGMTIPVLLLLGLSVAACGGGGGGLASAPPPITGGSSGAGAALPPNVPSSGIAIRSDQPFATLAVNYGSQRDGATITTARFDEVGFRYLPAEKVYEISLPGFAAGRLRTQDFYPNGVGGRAWNEVTVGATAAVQDVHVSTHSPQTPDRALTYTSFASWGGHVDAAARADGVNTVGIFVYGVPTAAGDVPRTGSASYAATLLGTVAGSNWGVVGAQGTATLRFDFANGTLNGSMRPIVNDAWSSYDLGTYAFRDTVFAVGSTRFGGAFEVPRMPGAASRFEGAFTGPQAAELMARWEAPFLIDQGGETWQGRIIGVMMGKKE